MWRHLQLFFTIISVGSSAMQDPLVVNTQKGRVRGKTVQTPTGRDVDAWYSIPFAQPPVGELRFRRPRPIDSWHDVKDVSELPNSCWQIKDDFYGSFEGATMWNANTEMSEDCLYLSIVVPKPRPRNSAVVVWVHGEAFYMGTSTLEVFDYPTFADNQKVIVVALQYRLANLGFLYMGTPDVPGNMGLFDQLLALQWIHDNIAYFGGNPNNITLMGESAGAVSISMHLLSPLSRSLFNQAIMQSGSAVVPWGIMSKQENMLRGQRLAGAVGCPSDLDNVEVIVECLRTVNESALIHNEISNGVADFPFVPIIDGAFFDELPIESLRKGYFKRTNIMMGSNTEEGYLLLFYFLSDIIRREENIRITRQQFEESVRRLFPHFNELALQAIIFEYTDWLNPEDGNSNLNALDKMIGDYHFTCNINQFANYYADDHNDVYMYNFQHRSTGNMWPKWAGTLQRDEISFIFGQPLNPKHSHYTEAEQDLSRQMMNYWGNFIKTGNPSEGSDRSYPKTNWPMYTRANKNYLTLNANGLGVGHGLRVQQCAFWEFHLPKLVEHSAECNSEEPKSTSEEPMTTTEEPMTTTEEPMSTTEETKSTVNELKSTVAEFKSTLDQLRSTIKDLKLTAEDLHSIAHPDINHG